MLDGIEYRPQSTTRLFVTVLVRQSGVPWGVEDISQGSRVHQIIMRPSA